MVIFSTSDAAKVLLCISIIYCAVLLLTISGFNKCWINNPNWKMGRIYALMTVSNIYMAIYRPIFSIHPKLELIKTLHEFVI